MNKIILVADHEPVIVQLLYEYLRESHEDYDILNATSGPEACKMAESHRPDLVIADWHTPEMSGIEIVKHLKDHPHLRDIPVIMTSENSSSTENMNMALSAGAIDYMEKPVDKEEFRNKIRTAFILTNSLRKIKELRQEGRLSGEIPISLAEAIPVPIFFQEGNGCFSDCNRRFGFLVRKEKKEIIGRTVHDILPGEAAKWCEEHFRMVMTDPKNTVQFELEVTDIELNRMHLQVSYSAFFHAGHPWGYIGSVTDISQVLNGEKQIRAQLELLHHKAKELYADHVEKLRAELDFKQRELAAHIGLLIQAEKEKDKLLEEINSLRPHLNAEGKTKLSSIAGLLRQELHRDSWLTFEAKFQEINFGFFIQLENKFPGITRNEKTLCAYLKMNLSSAEISRMTNKSLNSVNVALARLRSKLGTKNNDELKKRLSEMNGSETHQSL